MRSPAFQAVEHSALGIQPSALPMQHGHEQRDSTPPAPTAAGAVHSVTHKLPDGSKRKFTKLFHASARAGAEELDNTCEHGGNWSQLPPPPELYRTLNSITTRLLQIFEEDCGEEGEGVTSLALARLGSHCAEYWMRSECYEALLANDDVPRICLSMAVKAVALKRG